MQYDLQHAMGKHGTGWAVGQGDTRTRHGRQSIREIQQLDLLTFAAEQRPSVLRDSCEVAANDLLDRIKPMAKEVR
jgi:hypothetical protein